MRLTTAARHVRIVWARDTNANLVTLATIDATGGETGFDIEAEIFIFSNTVQNIYSRVTSGNVTTFANFTGACQTNNVVFLTKLGFRAWSDAALDIIFTDITVNVERGFERL